MTIEHDVFRGNLFIHSFLDFFVTGEVCVCKCVLHQSEEMQQTVPSLESMREEISYLSYKSAVLRFSQHVKIEYYHATK